jgi:hypothetical protein
MWKRLNVSVLLGQTLSKVEQVDNNELHFTTTEGKRYRMLHHSDCCESVSIEDICGDLQDLVGSPILQSEESTNQDDPPDFKAPEYRESWTWTFYRFATMKGQVVIRWYGESNGYYSESVDFEEITNDHC